MSRREQLEAMWRTLDDERNLAAMTRYFAPGYVRHSDEGDMSREEFRVALQELQDGFPDLQTRILDVIEEGERIAYRWESTGTHSAPYFGAPPTGKPIKASGITISSFDPEGLITEDWASWNRASVLHALGVIPLS